MKVIKLKTVHYVSKEGITLTMEKPYVEATEDNVKKMEYFLKEGYLEIIDLDKKHEVKEDKKEKNVVIEEPKSESKEPVVEENKTEVLEETETEETSEKKTKKSKK